MNWPANVSTRMEYIQKVFLSVQDYMQHNHDWDELFAFLNGEAPEFRSVGYESASMEIGLQELNAGKELNNWKNFYQLSAKAHTFHMDIGLGWAFAKTEISPAPYLKSLHPVIPWMVFDGMGYYNGLYKGRRTIKNQLKPEGMSQQELLGFDQGLGRRLWYNAKGEVKEAARLIQAFPSTRHPDLWRGLGIACGYVGGNTQADLELLLIASDAYSKQLQTGIVLATISRSASESLTADIELACKIICGKSLHDVLRLETRIRKKYSSESGHFHINSISQLESAFE